MLNDLSSLKKEYLIGCLLILTIAIVWFWGFNTAYFDRPDAYDYAQMGREIANGNGFSTLQIFPKHIPYFYENGLLDKENWPNLYRFPVPTLINAFFIKIVDDPIDAAILHTVVFFLLSLPVLFILAFKLTSLPVAVVSVILYASHPLIVKSSYNGMTGSSSLFFLLLTSLMLFTGKLSKWKCLSLGLICGISYLDRSQFILLVLLAGLYIWINQQKKLKYQSLFILLVGFFVIVGPWFIRNTIVTGKPTFSFSVSRAFLVFSYGIYSDFELQLDAPVGTVDAFINHGPAILKKVTRHLRCFVHLNFWAQVFRPDGIFLLFLFASFIYRRQYSQKKHALFRDGIVIFIICNFLIVSLIVHWPRYHFFTLPLIYIFAVNEIFIILKNISPRYSKNLVLVAVCLLVLFGSFRFYKVATTHKNMPPIISKAEYQSYKFLKKTVSRDTIIASNISYMISLLADCRTIRLPAFPDDLLKINDNYLSVDYVLLTRGILNPNQLPASKRYATDIKIYADYSTFIKSDEFTKRFKFEKALPNGTVLFKSVKANDAAWHK